MGFLVNACGREIPAERIADLHRELNRTAVDITGIEGFEPEVWVRWAETACKKHAGNDPQAARRLAALFAEEELDSYTGSWSIDDITHVMSVNAVKYCIFYASNIPG